MIPVSFLNDLCLNALDDEEFSEDDEEEDLSDSVSLLALTLNPTDYVQISVANGCIDGLVASMLNTTTSIVNERIFVEKGLFIVDVPHHDCRWT